MSTNACCKAGNTPEDGGSRGTEGSGNLRAEGSGNRGAVGSGNRGAVGERKTGRRRWTDGPGRSRRWTRVGELVPGVLLVLMPKCPLCFAGYLSVATGIGVSFTTAKFLRLLLIAVCVVSMTLILLRWLLHPLRKA